MQFPIEAIDWRSPKEGAHLKELSEHFSRVERTIKKLNPKFVHLSERTQQRLIKHPESYAFLLSQVRKCEFDFEGWERVSSLILSGEDRRNLGGNELSLVTSGPWANFRTRTDDDLKFFSEKEFPFIVEQLNAALTELHSGSPRAYQFFRDVTQMIVLRRRLNIKSFFSSSQISHPGRITLDNPDQMSGMAMIESLVHESVHSYLYMVEEKGRFLSTKGDPGIFISSPWTKNKICLHSFVHACFVWFSLQTLWLSWQSDTEIVPICEREKSISMIQRGFRSSSFDTLIFSYPDLIGHALKETLLQIREASLAT